MAHQPVRPALNQLSRLSMMLMFLPSALSAYVERIMQDMIIRSATRTLAGLTIGPLLKAVL